jgi:hypothetical protein
MVKAGARNEAASGRAMSLMALAGKLQTNAQAGQDSRPGVSYSQQSVYILKMCCVVIVAELESQGPSKASDRKSTIGASPRRIPQPHHVRLVLT